MAAKDYEIVEGCMGTLYLAKKPKNPNKRFPLMSEDRRPITDDEVLFVFERYLRHWCEDHPGENTVYVTTDDRKIIFEATLHDKEE